LRVGGSRGGGRPKGPVRARKTNRGGGGAIAGPGGGRQSSPGTDGKKGGGGPAAPPRMEWVEGGFAAPAGPTTAGGRAESERLTKDWPFQAPSAFAGAASAVLGRHRQAGGDGRGQDD